MLGRLPLEHQTIIIIIYFKNVHYFHAQQWLNVFPDMRSLHISMDTTHSECKPNSSISWLSSFTHSLQVFLPLPAHLTPATTTFLQADTQSSPLLRSTCPNHLNLPPKQTCTIPHNLPVQVNNIISSCGQALYAMKILKSQGLTTESLQIIFQSTILSRLLYASQAWFGFANENEINRLEAFLRKSIKSSFALPTLPSFKKLCSDDDDSLFASVRGNKNHVLSRFLPPARETTYNLRTRAHNFQIPSQKTSKLVDKIFFNRVLSKNSY